MITIGAGTIVHPRAEIRAEGGNCCLWYFSIFLSSFAGPIHIGENNIIEELALVHNPYPFTLSFSLLLFLSFFTPSGKLLAAKRWPLAVIIYSKLVAVSFPLSSAFKFYVWTCLGILPCVQCACAYKICTAVHSCSGQFYLTSMSDIKRGVRASDRRRERIWMSM